MTSQGAGGGRDPQAAALRPVGRVRARRILAGGSGTRGWTKVQYPKPAGVA